MTGTDDSDPSSSGPVENQPWPRHLEAHAWTHEAHPRLHGYDLHRDLAQNYSFAEVLLLSLRGEAPSLEHGRIFETTLLFLSPSTIAEAPAHSAVLARTFMARWSAVVSCGSTVLAEQTTLLLAEQELLLSWLDDPDGPLPASARCDDDSEREAVQSFIEKLGDPAASIPALGEDPSLMGALLAALHHCGLRDREHLLAAIVMARLPAVLAEVLPRSAGDLRRYPMDTPHFEYRSPRRKTTTDEE